MMCRKEKCAMIFFSDLLLAKVCTQSDKESLHSEILKGVFDLQEVAKSELINEGLGFGYNSLSPAPLSHSFAGLDKLL